jgi:hypothetical protein
VELFDYWEQNPPSHELLGVVATWLGWERKTQPSAPRPERGQNVLPFDNSKHTKERQDVAILQLAAFAKSGGGVIQRRKKQNG